MPAFEETALCRAPATEVFKLLYDATRFPEWWAGVARVETTGDAVRRYMAAWPDFAYPTRITQEQGRVTVSCLLSDIRQDWTLAPAPEGCRVHVRVELPEAEAGRLDAIRDEIRASLPRLAAAAKQRAT